ncbi:MAG TPA: Gfo/Idh/MocA family oxidoreductase [Candidatus Dormibacteraeota bacterium]|jgi:predicted dehydrogenase|nr:Gfo/Idh/MocA family oxidoreductase [Candidatus Dormibacteraeota bacterium]
MSEPFRLAVVGCGSIAPAWLGPLGDRTDIRIVALVDTVESNARSRAGEFGLDAPVFTGLEEALSATTPDVVCNLTPPALHHPVTLTALEAGCHVFTEKPLAAGLDQAAQLIDAADRAGRRLTVMQNRRYMATIRGLRDAVTGGAIGTPGLVGIDFFRGPRFGGFRDEMDSPLLLDMAIHTFDAARFITDGRAVAATCTEFNPPGSWYRGAAAALCTFELEGGLLVSYRGSWAATGLPTSWESAWRVVGSRGTAIWEGDSTLRCQVEVDAAGFERETREIEISSSWEGRSGHGGCIDEMLTALAEGRPAETDAHDNVHSLAMVLAAVASSSAGGRRIEIAEDGRSISS